MFILVLFSLFNILPTLDNGVIERSKEVHMPEELFLALALFLWNQLPFSIWAAEQKCSFAWGYPQHMHQKLRLLSQQKHHRMAPLCRLWCPLQHAFVSSQLRFACLGKIWILFRWPGNTVACRLVWSTHLPVSWNLEVGLTSPLLCCCMMGHLFVSPSWTWANPYCKAWLWSLTGTLGDAKKGRTAYTNCWERQPQCRKHIPCAALGILGPGHAGVTSLRRVTWNILKSSDPLSSSVFFNIFVVAFLHQTDSHGFGTPKWWFGQLCHLHEADIGCHSESSSEENYDFKDHAESCWVCSLGLPLLDHSKYISRTI